jgi:hypothetical protein
MILKLTAKINTKMIPLYISASYSVFDNCDYVAKVMELIKKWQKSSFFYL